MALAIQGDIQEIVFHFLAATLNRFLVDAGNERELSITWIIRFLREHADTLRATPLRFGETTEQKIDLTMVAHNLCIGLLLAYQTFALVKRVNRDGHFSAGL
ncbi:MAG: hypothetical protein HY258_11925, partial [Chloroflexi bacterium]|nr:hypothetical protein [Chloroflexota bacterium]